MPSRTIDILRREKIEMTLPALVELFVATKRTEGRSKNTVTWYSDMLRPFTNFLDQAATLKDITLDAGRAFIASLQERTTRFDNHPKSHQQEGGLSIATIHGYVRTLKVFGAWLQEDGLLPRNPFVRLKRPKLPETMIEILTDEEIKTLMDSTNPSCVLGARLYTIVSILLDTGIRANELITLKGSNIDMDSDRFKVMGKGSKERFVPIGATAKKAILRYVSTWRPQPRDDRCDIFILSL